MSKSFIEKRIAIVGLGLMGGSFAKAFAAAQGYEVYAYNRTHATLELAMVETIQGELNDEMLGTCELVILAGYPEVSMSWLEEMQDKIADGAIVIDTVGVKRSICERAFALAKGHSWTFVGTHPMAGTQFL